MLMRADHMSMRMPKGMRIGGPRALGN